MLLRMDVNGVKAELVVYQALLLCVGSVALNRTAGLKAITFYSMHDRLRCLQQSKDCFRDLRVVPSSRDHGSLCFLEYQAAERTPAAWRSIRQNPSKLAGHPYKLTVYLRNVRMCVAVTVHQYHICKEGVLQVNNCRCQIRTCMFYAHGARQVCNLFIILLKCRAQQLTTGNTSNSRYFSHELPSDNGSRRILERMVRAPEMEQLRAPRSFLCCLFPAATCQTAILRVSRSGQQRFVPFTNSW